MANVLHERVSGPGRRDRVEHAYFRSPAMMPVFGLLTCAFLFGPWTGRDPIQYTIAGVLIGIGIATWLVTLLVNRAMAQRRRDTGMRTG